MRYDHEMRKKQNLVRLVLCVFIGLVGVLGMSVFSLAEVQVSCENFPLHLNGKTAKLTSDCSKSLTVYGPGTLNLNRHTVSGPGTGSGAGITVQDEKAEIANGTVKGWNVGVDVRGRGYHKIVNLNIEKNIVGIRVRTDVNSVVNNYLKDNTIDDLVKFAPRGIRLEGDFNTVTNNYIENSHKGIRVDPSSNNNIIVSNTIVKNYAENCDIKGNDNLLVHNIATNGPSECFLIGDLEDGTIATSGNRLVNNTAFNCKAGGFVASLGSHDNSIGHNTAHCDLEDCSYDLQDAHATCEANTWFLNIAVTASPACILQ